MLQVGYYGFGMADVDRIERILNEYDRKVELYSRFCESVEHLLKDLLHTSDIRINAVASRPKERDSFEQKIKSNPKYVSLETVTDVAGARVITYFEDDVDRVDGIIRGEFEIDPMAQANRRSIRIEVNLRPRAAPVPAADGPRTRIAWLSSHPRQSAPPPAAPAPAPSYPPPPGFRSTSPVRLPG